MENRNNKFSLLVDACIDYLEIAIIRNDKIIDSYFEIQNKNLNKILNPSIANIIERNHFKKEDLENIYIINGPGSFTSVKSVVLFANTFKKVFHNTNLFYLNSNQWNVTQENEIVFIDAKTNLFYIGSNNFEKPFLIKKEEISKINNNKYTLYFYELENRKPLISKWNFNKEKFQQTNFIRPLYIKEPIYDYSKK